MPYGSAVFPWSWRCAPLHTRSTLAPGAAGRPAINSGSWTHRDPTNRRETLGAVCSQCTNVPRPCISASGRIGNPHALFRPAPWPPAPAGAPRSPAAHGAAQMWRGLDRRRRRGEGKAGGVTWKAGGRVVGGNVVGRTSHTEACHGRGQGLEDAGSLQDHHHRSSVRWPASGAGNGENREVREHVRKLAVVPRLLCDLNQAA
jgi:hypothetical protein